MAKEDLFEEGKQPAAEKRRQIESASRSNGQDRKKLRKRFDHEIG